MLLAYSRTEKLFNHISRVGLTFISGRYVIPNIELNDSFLLSTSLVKPVILVRVAVEPEQAIHEYLYNKILYHLTSHF